MKALLALVLMVSNSVWEGNVGTTFYRNDTQQPVVERSVCFQAAHWEVVVYGKDQPVRHYSKLPFIQAWQLAGFDIWYDERSLYVGMDAYLINSTLYLLERLPAHDCQRYQQYCLKMKPLLNIDTP